MNFIFVINYIQAPLTCTGEPDSFNSTHEFSRILIGVIQRSLKGTLNENLLGQFT